MDRFVPGSRFLKWAVIAVLVVGLGLAVTLPGVRPRLGTGRVFGRRTAQNLAKVQAATPGVRKPAGIKAHLDAVPGFAVSPGLAPSGLPKPLLDAWKIPLGFASNEGQTDPRVRFLAKTSSYTMFLTADSAVLELRKPEAKASILTLKLVGANQNARVSGVGPLPGKSNYLRGPDPSRWITGVPTYARVRYEGVYPGVDLVYYGNQRQLEHDFVVSPGADASEIEFAIEGADRVKVDRQGDLVMRSSSSVARLLRPVVYQLSGQPSGQLSTSEPGEAQAASRQPVAGRYVVSGRRVRFQVGGYDHSRPLVIDPVLVYSSYLGGSAFDEVKGIAVDSLGSVYVTGDTTSTDFPVSGAFQGSCKIGGMPPTCSDAFVTKFSADGSTLIYSTYLGGSEADVGTAIAVDSSGNAFVTGLTSSPDFPTLNPFQAHCGGFASGSCPAEDAFFVKLDSTGSGLLYSTYLGGSGADEANGIAIDSSGNAYVTGLTQSSGADPFPTSPGAFQPTCGTDSACNGGFSDAFVAKINPKASGVASLIYSTYLGGSGSDFGNAIAVDSSGNAYLTGSTTSVADFPIQGAFQTSCKLAAGVCNGDAFVTKLNPTGTALVYSTYLGGSGKSLSGTSGVVGDFGNGIAVDSTGDAYVAGQTASPDFPVTSGAFQTKCGTDGACNPAGGFNTSDGFVTKVNPAGSALVYSSFLGGSGADSAGGVALGLSGTVYVVGSTSSPERTDLPFPATSNAIQGIPGGAEDVFVSEFDSTGAGLIFSTYLGGSGNDVGGAVAADSTGDAFVAGSTASSNFPIMNQTSGSCLGTCGNGSTTDAFVAELGSATGPFVSLSPATLFFGYQSVGSPSATLAVTLTNSGSASATISTISFTGPNSAEFGETNTCEGTVAVATSCTISVTFTPGAGGIRSASLSVADNSSNTPQVVAVSGVGSFGPTGTVSFTGAVSGTLKGDLAVWRADTSSWYVLPSNGGAAIITLQGLPGDVPVAGDYDGDGKSDYGVWRPSTGTWYVILSSSGKMVTQQWGAAGDVPVPADYDGDGKADYAVWRPSNGTWYVIPSGGGANITQAWGVAGDIPVVGDYDGDGKSDFAIWRPGNGTWYVIPSSGGPNITQQWGAPGDIPVEGDYDGDGKADFAVWRSSTGTWYVIPSGGGANITKQWGAPGDIPVVGDYDGDRKNDEAVWRPSNGTWYISNSSNGTETTTAWGVSGDLPATHLALQDRRNKHIANFDGDRKSDVAVFRPSSGTWYVIPSSKPTSSTTERWGASGDIVVPGDYDGDGKTDFAVWRPSNGTWYVIPSSAPTTPITTAWGVSTDIPVPGDYDGDGKTDFAVWRPSNGTFYVILSSTGKSMSQQWGVSTDIPVPGDYDGDGKTDFAVWRPSNGTFYVILSSTGKSTTTQWGVSTDKPVPGDYDGDGKTDFAVWRPSNGTFYVILSSTGKSTSKQWGVSTDIPVPKDYDGDEKTDYAVWRPSNGTWYIVDSSTGKTTTTVWGVSTDVPVNKPTGQ